jgi:Flp pilus assembly protein TadG
MDGSSIVMRARRFLADESGVTVVEFALVSPWFIWLMLGTAEVTLLGFAQANLDFAMAETARRVRTGEVQLTGLSETQVKAAICDDLNQILAMNCGNLHLDIDSYEGFVDVENDEPIDASGEFDDSDLNFSPGEPSEIVMARGFYQWEIITPYFDVFLANVGSRDHLLSSTILFRNEPYETETEDVV